MSNSKILTPPNRPQLINGSFFGTGQQNIPVPVGRGERIYTVQWISPVYALRAANVGGGKKSGGGQYDYYGTIVGVFGMGPFSTLVGIIQDGTAAYPSATPWVPNTYHAGQQVYYQGVFYTANTTTTSTPPSSAWNVFSVDSSTANADGYTSIDITWGSHNYGTIRFYWGTMTQVADPALTNTAIVGSQTHPAYLGQGYVVLDNFYFGQGIQTPPNLQIIARSVANQSLVTGSSATLNDGQVSPIAFLAEILTDARYGCGLASSKIDSTSLQAAADLLRTNPALSDASPYMDTSTTMADVADRIATMTDAWVRHNAATDLIETGVFQHGVTPSTYTTLTYVHLTQKPKITETGWAKAQTAVTVGFPDRTRLYQGAVTPPVLDLRARTILGEPRNQSEQRDWITREAQAAGQAAEWMKYHGRPPAQVELKVARCFALGTGISMDPFINGIRPGDWVQVDLNPEPGGTELLTFCRVLERTIPRTGEVTLTCMADPTSTPIIHSPPANPLPLTNSQEPAEVASARIIECPPLLASGAVGTVLALAERSEAHDLGFYLLLDSQIDPGGNYVNLGWQGSFATPATLAADLSATAESSAIELTISGTPSASPLRLVVDTTQIDATIFNGTPPGISPANNDTLLLFLVTVSGGAMASDSSGFAEIEILSVNTWTLVGTSGTNATYAIDALRARMGTVQRSFAAASTEAWLIPRSSLVSFSSADLAALAANILASTTPTTALFRFQVVTAKAIRAEADCSDHDYVPPTASPARPQLTWSSPTFSGGTYTYGTSSGGTITVAGQWVDLDANIVSYSLAWRLGTDPATEVSVFSQSANNAWSVPFSASLTFTTPGSCMTLYARCVDAYGISAEVTAQVCVPPSSGSQVVLPTFSPPGGVQSSPTTSVTIASTTSGAQISYSIVATGTSPGSPTPGSGGWSALASSPVTVSVSANYTVYAIAKHSGMTDSAVASASYWLTRGNGNRLTP